MSTPKTGGPIVDPLREPADETEAFLIELSRAYSDFDEFVANWKLTFTPHAQVCMPRRYMPYRQARAGHG